MLLKVVLTGGVTIVFLNWTSIQIIFQIFYNWIQKAAATIPLLPALARRFTRAGVSSDKLTQKVPLSF